LRHIPYKLSNMKKSIHYLLLSVISISLLAFVNSNKAADKNFSENFSETLKKAKAYTLEVAEKMPAEDYTFRPHDSVRSFGEQMAHIGMSTYFLNATFIKGEQLAFDPAEMSKTEKMTGASKEECIRMIDQNFDELISTLEGMSPEELQSTFVFFFEPDKPEFTKEQGFLLIRDHITHHRAQAITSLRMKGHPAPNYR
jgi:uncharacterized damage-inducible protein DinB